MKSDERVERLFEAFRKESEAAPGFDRERVRHGVIEAFGRRAASPARLGLLRPALAAALVLSATLAAWWLWPAPSTSFEVAGKAGDVGAWLTPRDAAPLSLSFSEGTKVELAAGSRGRVSALSPEGARLELAQGQIDARVTPRANSSWSFGAGPFDVTVLGTNLSISWLPARGEFALGVSEGSVLVRGPFISSAQRVGAGQVCRVDLGAQRMELGQLNRALPVTKTAPEVAASAAVPLPASSASEPSAPSEPRSGSAPSEPRSGSAPNAPNAPNALEDWRALERQGQHREAIAAAERAGLAKLYATEAPEALLELAQAARLSGRTDIERAALLACRERHPGRSETARAAYLLGRLASGAEAARWFELYLSEQPRGLLAREAAGRLIESQLKAGNRSAARRAASSYVAAYPDGPHATLAQQVLAGKNGN
jgi:TolA-binding protein